MAGKDAGMVKKWVYVVLVSLLAAFLLLSIFAVERAGRLEASFASEDKAADEKVKVKSEKEEDEVESKKGKGKEAEDANEVDVPRPDHNHPAFKERVKERERMVAQDIKAEGMAGWMREVASATGSDTADTP